ncbi:MAG: spore maturation protein, partial [Ruminococcus sp.]|nr:spore maturation protein [Ruminococcus sp.]
MLTRPISGSASLSVLDKLLGSVSPDSFAGRTARVMMGATETTLYTITIYYSSVKIKPDIRVFICSFAADIAGFILAPLVVRLYYGI